MKRFLKKIGAWIKTRAKSIAPGKNAGKGAAVVLLSVATILIIAFGLITAYNIKDPWIFLFTIVIAGLNVLAAF